MAKRAPADSALALPKPAKRSAKVVAINRPPKLTARQKKLIEAHLAMVRPLAVRVMRTLPVSFELDDLIQAGHLGLIKAAKRYTPDEHNGTPFSAYARFVIRGGILDSVRKRAYVENTRPAIYQMWSHDAEEPAALATTTPEPRIEAISEDDLDKQRELERVQAAILALPPRLAKVIELYYSPAEPRYRDVGDAIGVTGSRASALRVEAIDRLRELLKAA